MTTTDYVSVDALQSYIEHFIEESEKQQARYLNLSDIESTAYYDGMINALEELKERIDKMKVSL